MRHIMKCRECGTYLLKEKCKCGGTTLSVRPPKYSPDDRYASYRRRAKKEIMEKRG